MIDEAHAPKLSDPFDRAQLILLTLQEMKQDLKEINEKVDKVVAELAAQKIEQAAIKSNMGNLKIWVVVAVVTATIAIIVALATAIFTVAAIP